MIPQHWTSCITFHGAVLVCVDRLSMNQLYYGDNLEVNVRFA